MIKCIKNCDDFDIIINGEKVLRLRTEEFFTLVEIGYQNLKGADSFYQEAYEEGSKEGYSAGLDDANDSLYDKGYNEGSKESQDSYDESYKEGYDDGFREGETKGRKDMHFEIAHLL